MFNLYNISNCVWLYINMPVFLAPTEDRRIITMAEYGDSLEKSIVYMQQLHTSAGIMKSMNFEILESLYKLQSGTNASEATKDLESIARKLKVMALSNDTTINLVSNYLQVQHKTQR